MKLDSGGMEPIVDELLNNRRGPKTHPERGISTSVPCKLNAMLVSLGRTQEQVAEAISSTPVFMKLMGKIAFSRGSLALIASGRLIPSRSMLAVLCAYLGCKPEDLYEPYVVSLIDHDPEKWVKEGGYWDDTSTT